MAHSARPRPSLRRRFVTPEGVDLLLELGSAGTRAAAFVLDMALMLAVLVCTTMATIYLMRGRQGPGQGQVLTILWLLGAFALRNGWFVLWEMGGRGATPGKRVAGLRVVARDGARLTGGAVVARNAMREVEVFLPLSFLGTAAADGTASTFLTLFSLAWSGIFLLFPLFNRDRLRVGDLIAGTWVVRTARARLAGDLVATRPRARRTFPEAALALYGEYELQTLEEVLRGGRAESLTVVADAIRTRAGIAADGDDAGFLADYYAALCVRLERGMLMGRRRADKFAGVERR
ncbi:RDD family protein [Sphingomonas bacterium]|uniref:RDD family protein n=1 Tax=Sphingomonas bacterium TaxID=1895847 RepID=UPI001575EAEF|nr:RDD family protein [Sphingomonas bacterium]